MGRSKTGVGEDRWRWVLLSLPTNFFAEAEMDGRMDGKMDEGKSLPHSEHRSHEVPDLTSPSSSPRLKTQNHHGSMGYLAE